MNKRKITLLVLGILIVVVITLGITRAYMRNDIENTSVTDVALNSCAKLSLIDGGNSINLENIAPKSDNMGLNTKPYNFTIKSTCEVSVRYKVYLAVLDTNTLASSNIKYAIREKGTDNVVISGVLTEQPESSSDFEGDETRQIKQGIKGTPEKIYTIMQHVILKNTEEEYELYLWVDGKVIDKETMNKTFSVGVIAKSFEEVENPTLGDICFGRVMSNCLTRNYTMDNAIIYHSKEGAVKGEEKVINSELGAGDESYRYTGASADVNNYVCFGSKESPCPENNLYRIIGFFKNDDNKYEMKLIKNTKLNTGFWSGSNRSPYTNDWSKSKLRTEVLNNETGDYWRSLEIDADKIVDHDWIVSGGPIEIQNVSNAQIAYNYEVAKECETCTNKVTYTTLPNKVGLMYVSDFTYATDSSIWNVEGGSSKINRKPYNWLHIMNTISGTGNTSTNNEWTISRTSTYEWNAFYITETGSISGYGSTYNSLFSYRPTFYLDVNVVLSSGIGTSTDPYRIK